MLYIQQNHADINQNSVLFYYAAAQILFLYVPFYILLSAVSSSASKKQKKPNSEYSVYFGNPESFSIMFG